MALRSYAARPVVIHHFCVIKQVKTKMVSISSVPLTILCVMIAAITVAALPFIGSKYESCQSRPGLQTIRWILVLWIYCVGYGILLSFAIGFSSLLGGLGGSLFASWIVAEMMGFLGSKRRF